MGMAASQARYLQLAARKTNIEYQGQQINQERTVLSQQTTALYNSLLQLQVPTPPSTQDYTKVQYTGADGASNFTIGTIKPKGNAYIVEIQTSATGDYLSKNNSKSVVENVNNIYPEIPVKQLNTASIGSGQLETTSQTYNNNELIMSPASGTAGYPEGYYTVDSNNNFHKATGEYDSSVTYYTLSKATQQNPITTTTNDYLFQYNPQDPNITYYVSTGDGGVRMSTAADFIIDANGNKFLNPDLEYYTQDPTSNTYMQNKSGTQRSGYLIEGQIAYDFKDVSDNDLFLDRINDNSWSRYLEAIKNKFGSSDQSIDANSFYVYFKTSSSGVEEPFFALKTDVESMDNRTETFSYIANGSYTKSEQVEDCNLNFDASGRIVSIDVPTRDDNGTITGYNTIELTASKITDTAAYEDAYNEYEYANYKYDKAIEEINAKTEIIHQQDRNLELKLTRLDNERKAVDTELDAVKKVIQDNIDKSFKTFNG